jgi:hypothetical protein
MISQGLFTHLLTCSFFDGPASTTNIAELAVFVGVSFPPERIEGGHAPLTTKSSYGGHDTVRRNLTSSKHPSAASGVGQSTASAALEQKPGAALRLIDPGLDQTRAGDVAVFVAQSVGLPQTGGKLKIVVTELSRHVERGDVVGIIV